MRGSDCQVSVSVRQRTAFSGSHLCLHLVCSGEARIIGNGATSLLREDGYLIKNPGSAHTLEAGASPVLSIRIHPNLLAPGRFEEALTPRDYNLEAAISSLLEEGREHRDRLILELDRARVGWRQEYFLAERGDSPTWLTTAMKTAREFMLSRLAQPASLPEVAEAAALSEFHFHRLFSRFHGMTPGRYYQRERVRRACRKLVLTDKPVSEVALDCGSLSSTSFYRTFRPVTGATPDEFRQRTKPMRSNLLPLYSSLQSC